MTTTRRATAQEYFRPAFLPALLLAVTLVVGLLTQHLGTATVIRFIACALALIVVVFAWQARSYVWIVAIAAVAVLWNPAFPLPFSGVGWDAAHVLAAAVAMAAALFVRQRMEGTSVRARH